MPLVDFGMTRLTVVSPEERDDVNFLPSRFVPDAFSVPLDLPFVVRLVLLNARPVVVRSLLLATVAETLLRWVNVPLTVNRVRS